MIAEMMVNLVVGNSDSRRKEFKSTSLPNQVRVRLFGLIFAIIWHVECLEMKAGFCYFLFKLYRSTFRVEETQGYPIVIFNALIVIIALFLNVT